MNLHEEIRKIINEIKLQGYNNICIWAPALNVGGGTYVYCNFVNYLTQNTDLNVYYMDYLDSYARHLLKNNKKVKFLTYDEKNPNFPLKDKTIILVNSTRIVQLTNMNPDNKVLFWHYETIKCGWDLVLIDNETKKYFKLAKDNNAMIYHDWSGRYSLNMTYNVGFKNKDYFYITLPPVSTFCDKKYTDQNSINIAFLSRLYPDKIQSLFYLIDNFSKYQSDKKRRLHIIGDGKSKKDVLEFCKKYEDNIEFIFTGTISRNNLDSYLIDNIDILFAIGTSVLEGAKLKLPSVMLFTGINKPIKSNEAIWIYNSKEHTVAIVEESKQAFGVKCDTFNDIIDSVYQNKNGKRDQGRKCYKYYLDNHSSYDEMVIGLLNALKNTTLTFRKIQKCIRYIPYTCMKITIYRFFGFNLIKKYSILNRVKVKLLMWSIYRSKIKPNLEIYHILGIKFLEKRIMNVNLVTYHILGIKVFSRQIKSVFKFPATLFKDDYK
ncbi:glycosyltransferase [Campylobacter porcelli]|uniref:Glycosyltransferase, family 1 n=1 Tax=Campylobacter porcelli TaxID=1660073 RepID=A0A1X9SY60_9BACT|nr:glycosyltransferase [Campylobacter sp. RM6137]ARR01151.1 glycosyltransferase, family 1 [Campylobacter sp. RM6137]